MIIRTPAFFYNNHGFARIPFSTAAVTILILSSVVTNIALENAKKSREQYQDYQFKIVNRIVSEEELTFETIAYNSLMEILSSLTSTEMLNEKCLNSALKEKCDENLKAVYPKIIEDYKIYMESCFVSIKSDWWKILPDHSIDTNDPEAVTEVYLILSGTMNIRISQLKIGGLEAARVLNFYKQVQIPLPLLINTLKIFKAQSLGCCSSMARLTQYILSSTVQLRVFSGSDNAYHSSEELLSESDVERAVNLAIALESARLFRVITPVLKEDQEAYAVIQRYQNTNRLDPADLFILLEKMHNIKIDLGEIISRSIRVYTDEFIFQLLKTFWQDKTPDTVVEEPLFPWSVLINKGETFSKNKIKEFLKNFPGWMMIPPFLFTRFGSEKISKITRYAASVDCESKKPLVLPVSGDYDLFSMPYTARWFVLTGGVYTDSENWPPPELVVDVVDLLLGESTNDNFLPEPFKVTFFSNFGFPETISYYLVNQSFIAHYVEKNSPAPYFDCLKHLILTLGGGITNSANDFSSGVVTHQAGLIDLMQRDSELLGDRIGRGLDWENILEELSAPDDPASVLWNGTNKFLYGPIKDAIDAFRELAREQEVLSVVPGSNSWFEVGLLHKESKNGGLYRLLKDTVELFYELFLTLKKSADASAGKFDGNWAWNIPAVYFAPIDASQTKESESDHFNFRRDGVKHAYNSVWPVVLLHLAGSKKYFHPDFYSTGEFKNAVPPIAEEAWLLYGLDKYPTELCCSNMHLWDDVHKSIKSALNSAFGTKTGIQLEIDAGLTMMDLITDNRKYGFSFHEFLWLYIGRPLLSPPELSPESTTEKLIESNSGWLDIMMLSTVPDELQSHIDHQNIIRKIGIDASNPFKFKKEYSVGPDCYSYVISEQFSIEQSPAFLSNGVDLEIEITGPEADCRFVSIFEDGVSLCDVSFTTNWNVEIEGKYAIALSTHRNCLFGKNGKRPLRLEENIVLDFNFIISTFSGWPLCDLKYPMTKSVFESYEIPYDKSRKFSKQMQTVLKEQIEIETYILDVFDMISGVLYEHPDGILRSQADYYDAYYKVPDSIDFYSDPQQSTGFIESVTKFIQSKNKLEKNIETDFEITFRGYKLNFFFDNNLLYRKSYTGSSSINNIVIEWNEDDFLISCLLAYSSVYLNLNHSYNYNRNTSEQKIGLSGHSQRYHFYLDDRNERRNDIKDTIPIVNLKYENFILDIELEILPEPLSEKFERQFLREYEYNSCSTISGASKSASSALFLMGQYFLLHNITSSEKISLKLQYTVLHHSKRIDVVTFNFFNVSSLSDLSGLLKEFCLIQYELISSLIGAAGDVFLNLPSKLFHHNYLKNYKGSDLLFCFENRIPGKISYHRYRLTLDRCCGTSEIYNRNEFSKEILISSCFVQNFDAEILVLDFTNGK